MRKTRKPVAIGVVLALVAAIGVGGTLAWLTAETPEVKNTFSPSDINITLEETDAVYDNEADVKTNSYKMIPGWTITKDPKATVLANSEDCYLFVKLEKSSNFDMFMEYQVAEGWTQLKGTDNQDIPDVYYRVFDSRDDNNDNVMGTAYSVLLGDEVKVKDTVTKAMMNALTVDTYPTLGVKAYAVQLYESNDAKFAPFDAWTKAENQE